MVVGLIIAGVIREVNELRQGFCLSAPAKEAESFVPLPSYALYVTVAGVRGDGRCLFRAVAYGHNVQEKRGAQDSERDEQQADQLRNLVSHAPKQLAPVSCHGYIRCQRLSHFVNEEHGNEL